MVFIKKLSHKHFSVDFLEVYLEPTSMMERFRENKQQLLAVNDFRKKAPS